MVCCVWLLLLLVCDGVFVFVDVVVCDVLCVVGGVIVCVLFRMSVLLLALFVFVGLFVVVVRV